MENGGAITIPVSVVEQVRLKAEGEPPDPRTGGAHAPVRSTSPSEALYVFGGPAEFQQGTRNPGWKPEPGFDENEDVLAPSRSRFQQGVNDPTWEPESGFDENEDVMAPSRSRFQKGVFDSTWKPTDGFRRRGVSMKTPGAARAGVREPTAWECGESILGSSAGDLTADSIRVNVLSDDRLSALRLPLYQADGKVDGSERRAVFTKAAGRCMLVGGDLEPLLGLRFTGDDAVSHSMAAYNRALAFHPRSVPESDRGKIEYAHALLVLADPHASGHRQAGLMRIENREELSEILARKPETCSKGRWKRWKQARRARKRFTPPEMVEGEGGTVVSFLTWTEAGGTIHRNTVRLGKDGIVSVRREILAEHLGEHQEPL
jgi:hypothetical protein